MSWDIPAILIEWLSIHITLSLNFLSSILPWGIKDGISNVPFKKRLLQLIIKGIFTPLI
jgi:hypothetical protein